MIKPYYESESGLGKLYHGDCLEIMKEIENKSIDLVLTDPPYNVNRKYDGKYNDNKDDYKFWCKEWFNLLFKFQSPMIFSIGLKNLNMWYEIKPPDWIYCWFKNNNMGKGNTFSNISIWEPFLIYGKTKRIGTDGIYLPIIPQKDTGGHDCPKPLKLFIRLINDLTNKMNLIFDPFIGSGTTAVACEHLNRRWIGIEISQTYCDIAAERIKRETAQLKLEMA